MLFESEILRDYPEFLKYVKVHRAMFKKTLFLNRCTADPSDYINDAIVKFYEESPSIYNAEVIKKHIRHFMYLEGKKVEDYPFEDFRDGQGNQETEKIISDAELGDYELNAFGKIGKGSRFYSSVQCDYFVLNDGRVMSHMKHCNRFKLLKPSLKNGRAMYRIGKEKREVSDMASHLVYSKYCGEIKKGQKIFYIDGDTHNNRYTNLRLVERKTHLGTPKRCRRARFRIFKFRSNLINYIECSLFEKTGNGAPCGERHGKFKGYYVIDGHKYASSYQAGKETGLNYRTIQRKCKLNKKGFYFLPTL